MKAGDIPDDLKNQVMAPIWGSPDIHNFPDAVKTFTARGMFG
jgi:hypothetical protein